MVSNMGVKGHVTADAVQFIPQDKDAEAKGDKTASVSTKKEGSSADLKKLEDQMKKLVKQGPSREMVMGIEDEKKVENVKIHIRGSVANLGAVVPRGFLQVATLGKAPVIDSKESGRRELAEWIADPKNPLTARVMANRVWHWLMGDGIVRTVDNFGTTGELPSHPELLDHLATQFVEQGWSVKKLVRSIVLSPHLSPGVRPRACERSRESPVRPHESPTVRRRVHPRRDAVGERPARSRRAAGRSSRM